MKSPLSVRISARRAPAASCSCVIIAIGLATVSKQLRGLGVPMEMDFSRALDIGEQRPPRFLRQMVCQFFVELCKRGRHYLAIRSLLSHDDSQHFSASSAPAAAVPAFTYAWCVATM